MDDRRKAARRRSAAASAWLLASCGLIGACRTPVQPAQREYEGVELAVRLSFRPLPERMPGSEGDTPEQIELGRRLFFERGISLTKSQSCNDCHRLDEGRAGVDNEPTSRGARGIAGQRNSPTVLNSGFQIAQFWDGRAPDLVEQAKGPPLNPIEMAMRSEADIVETLAADEEYRRAFARAFRSDGELTFHNAARAIAAFERTLVTPSRFDRYLRGDGSALGDDELRGLRRFVATGCVECHSGPAIGGRTLQKLGIYHPYERQSDAGRHAVTGAEADRFVFKVPMLRNVTLTAPYFHDGQVATLSEAVRQMAWMQLDQALSSAEVVEIVAFLRTLEAERPLEIAAP
jgi:cytochrome c peroxidase